MYRNNIDVDLMGDDLCKKCFIKIMNPSKKEVKSIVMTDYDTECACCGRYGPVVDYVDKKDR